MLRFKYNGDMSKIKIYNAKSKRKETFPESGAKKLRVYSALPVPPTAARARDLVGLRLFCLVESLGKVLQIEGRLLELVDTPETAEVALTSGSFEGITTPFVLELGPTVELPIGEELQNYNPGELRYWLAFAHYRTPLNDTEALPSAAAALERLQSYVLRYQTQGQTNGHAKPASEQLELEGWLTRFTEQLNDDLNLPRALTVCWTMLQSELSPSAKLTALAEFDKILGFGLGLIPSQITEKLGKTPTTSREGGGNFPQPNRPKAQNPKVAATKATPDEAHPRVGNSRNIRSFLNEPDKADFTVSLVAKNNLAELRPTVESVLNFGLRSKQKIEIVAVDLASSEAATAYLETTAHNYRNFRVIYAEDLGEAAARNLAFKQGRGRWLMLLDTGLIVKGDIFAELFKIIEPNDKPALYGLYPLELVRENEKLAGYKPKLLTSNEPPTPVEALEGGLLCFRRGLVEEVGFMDERFRYPYALDLDYSQSFHDKGYQTIALPGLARLIERTRPISERPNYGLTAEEQTHQRQKNWQHYLKSWGL